MFLVIARSRNTRVALLALALAGAAEATDDAAVPQVAEVGATTLSLLQRSATLRQYYGNQAVPPPASATPIFSPYGEDAYGGEANASLVPPLSSDGNYPLSSDAYGDGAYGSGATAGDAYSNDASGGGIFGDGVESGGSYDAGAYGGPLGGGYGGGSYDIGAYGGGASADGTNSSNTYGVDASAGETPILRPLQPMLPPLTAPAPCPPAENIIPSVATESITPAVQSKSSSPCHPQCSWQCEDRRCDEVCTPKCAAPVCETRCYGPDLSGCTMQCDEPSCANICPERACPQKGCPVCQTTCSEPKCKLQCPSTQPCQTVCETPRCEWECKAPEMCPKPECKMVCESPRQCSSSSTHVALPPLRSGEIAVKQFTPAASAISGNALFGTSDASNSIIGSLDDSANLDGIGSNAAPIMLQVSATTASSHVGAPLRHWIADLPVSVSRSVDITTTAN